MGHLHSRSSAPTVQPRGRGDGLEKRLIEAAERGDAVSQCNLGILYANGLDDNGYAVKGNRPQAVRWLLAAAEQGLPRAQIKLAEVYADGPDVRGSHATACGWFLLAAVRLHGVHLHNARSGYERIASHLTPAQIAEAKRFARDRTRTRLKEAANPGSPNNPDGGRWR
jgi:TPR repeat protein